MTRERELTQRESQRRLCFCYARSPRLLAASEQVRGTGARASSVAGARGELHFSNSNASGTAGRPGASGDMHDGHAAAANRRGSCFFAGCRALTGGWLWRLVVPRRQSAASALCSVLCWQASERRCLAASVSSGLYTTRRPVCKICIGRPVTHHRRGAEGVLQSHSAVVVETNEHQTRLVPRIRELELFYDDDVG